MNKRLVLAALTAIALAGPVRAQQVGEADRQRNPIVQIVGGVKTADSTAIRMRMTSDGAVQTAEQAPGFDQYVEKVLFTTASMAAGGADSCVAFDNHRNPLGLLSIKIVPTWAAQTVADYAIQIRYHFLGATDTSSVFPIFPVRQLTNPVPAPTGAQTASALCAWPAAGTVLHAPALASGLGMFSSFKVGSIITGPGIAEGTTLVSKGTGDSAITVSIATTAANAGTLTFWTGAGTDSTGQLFNGSSVLGYPSEIRLHMAKANLTGANAFPQAHEFALALPQYFGLNVRPTSISIRVRNVNGPAAMVSAYYTSGPQ